MTAAASKYTSTAPSSRKASGKMPGARVATTENSQATPVPIAMRVYMLRLRVRTDAHPRTKNGQPAHSTTGVASTSWVHADVVAEDVVVEPRDEVASHAEDEDGHGQGDADPEPAGHVAQLLRRAGVCGDDDGFERHAADGTGARSVLSDLGVHRARVLDDLPLTRRRRLAAGAIVPAWSCSAWSCARVGDCWAYFSRSARNLSLQPGEQKEKRSPSASAVSAVFGSTVMPHTGSVTWRRP
jgi:hypothetical protein